jgi:tetratricopeptide (TPR) repeat protein
MNSQKTYYCNAAEMLKNEGNAHVKAERYSDALPKYSKALENLKAHSGADVNTLKLGLLNNSALCHLKMEHFGEARELCEEALKVDAKNFKALFRRGQAQSGMGNLSEAFLDVRQAANLQPSDKAISAELQQLRKRLQERGIDEATLKREEKHEVSAVWQEQGSEPASSSSATTIPPADILGASPGSGSEDLVAAAKAWRCPSQST